MARKVKRVVKAVAGLRYAKLHPWKLGIAIGLVCALYALFVVIFADKFLINAAFLLEIYGWLGFRLTGINAILGIVYCFIDGFVGGAVVAWIYNKLL